MTFTAEQIIALRIIKTLRCGTANVLSANAISIGTRDIEKRLVSISEEVFNGNASSKVFLVEGDWGTGKSHLKVLLSGRLVEKNIPFLHTCIDARGSSLAHIHRAVPTWMNMLRIGAAVGLRDLIYHEIIPRKEIDIWTSRRYNFFADGLRMALSGNELGWLLALGNFFEVPDSSYQHEKAFSLVLSCADLLHSIGRGGLVLLLDEAENIDRQFDIRGRRKSYDTIWRLTQHPNIVTILFVTKRLFIQVEADIQAGHRTGWSNWAQSAKAFVLSFEKNETICPPQFNNQMAQSLIERVCKIFSTAYSEMPSDFLANNIINYWQQTPTRAIRILLRMAINELDLLRQKRAINGISP